MRAFYVLMVLVTLGIATGIGLTMTKLEPTEIVRPLNAASGALEPVDSDPRFPPLPPADGPQPVAVVEGSTTFHFGEMEIGSSGNHAWKFHNAGDFPLELRQGESTCKCTIAGVESNKIPPGGTAEVSLRWTVKGDTPMFRQSAAILTNDPGRRHIDLVVEGVITDTLRIIPAHFSSRKPRKAPTTFESNVYCLRTDTFKITGYRLSNPQLADYFEVEWVAMEDALLGSWGAKGATKVTVRVLPGLPEGSIDQKVVLTTNLPERPEVMITLALNDEGAITLVAKGWNPDFRILDLGDIRQSTGQRKKLRLMIRGEVDHEVELRVAEVTPDFINVTLGELEPGGHIKSVPLGIEIPPGSPLCSYIGGKTGQFGELKLETTHPRAPKWSFKLHFNVVP